MAALEGYINDTSSALFSLAAAVMGPSSADVQHLARHAGLAQGIVQVMASLPLDASQRRLFVPQQILAKHGCGPEDVFAGKQTPDLREALDDMFGEARAHLGTAETLLLSVTPDDSTGLSSPGAGQARSGLCGASRQRPLCGAAAIKISDVVDTVARIALARFSG